MTRVQALRSVKIRKLRRDISAAKNSKLGRPMANGKVQVQWLR